MTRSFMYFMIFSTLALGGCDTADADTSSGQSGRIRVTISGEDIATEGIRFPSGSEVTVVDGWEIEPSHVLVTVGNVTLSDNPDLAPSDQSRTGTVLARADGPWAIDLSVPGTVPASGGEGMATPLTVLER